LFNTCRPTGKGKNCVSMKKIIHRGERTALQSPLTNLYREKTTFYEAIVHEIDLLEKALKKKKNNMGREIKQRSDFCAFIDRGFSEGAREQEGKTGKKKECSLN